MKATAAGVLNVRRVAQTVNSNRASGPALIDPVEV
jgi:hypothetical protein